MNRKIWVILLAVWFALYGFLSISNVRFDQQGFLMGILAIAVALFAILDR